MLRHFLSHNAIGRALVFTRTKHGADKVARHLSRAGIRAEAIHGNKSQNARVRAINEFKSDSPPVLVATDIAARGLDIDEISHVINYDLPNVPETYVHRIGANGSRGGGGSGSLVLRRRGTAVPQGHRASDSQVDPGQRGLPRASAFARRSRGRRSGSGTPGNRGSRTTGLGANRPVPVNTTRMSRGRSRRRNRRAQPARRAIVRRLNRPERLAERGGGPSPIAWAGEEAGNRQSICMVAAHSMLRHRMGRFC